MSLPGLPYVVVDANLLRDPATILPLLDEHERSEQQILLPFHARHELLKGGGNTLEASMKLLTRRPQAVSVAQRLVVLCVHERQYRAQVATTISHASTRDHRSLLRALLSGATISRDALAEERRVASAIAESEQFALLMQQGATGLRKDIARSERTRIRNALQHGDREPFREVLFGQEPVRTWLHRALMQVSVPFATARKLTAFPSITALDIATLLLKSLHWSVVGGVENAKQLENEGPDAEAIVLALYGRGLYTKDSDTLNQYEDMKAIAERTWP